MSYSAPLIASLIWGGLFLLSGGYVISLAVFSKPDADVQEQPDPVRIFSILLGATLSLTGLATVIGSLG